MFYINAKDRERFFSRIEKTDSCWLWLGWLDHGGYGQFAIKSKQFRASRVSYFIHYGVHPGKELVCHSCDNPACVNPDHLFLGSSLDNAKDRDTKGRTALGVRHGKSRLEPYMVQSIRLKKANGESARRLAKEYSVSETHIYDILKGKAWAHIP